MVFFIMIIMIAMIIGVPIGVFCAIITLSSPIIGGTSRCSRSRKSKGFFCALMEEQQKIQKRNNSHRGVMCGPGGSKRRKF